MAKARSKTKEQFGYRSKMNKKKKGKNPKKFEEDQPVDKTFKKKKPRPRKSSEKFQPKRSKKK